MEDLLTTGGIATGGGAIAVFIIKSMYSELRKTRESVIKLEESVRSIKEYVSKVVDIEIATADHGKRIELLEDELIRVRDRVHSHGNVLQAHEIKFAKSK